MTIFPRYLALITLAILGTPAHSEEPSTLDLPPVMQRQYGRISIKRSVGENKPRIHGLSKNKGSTRIVAPKSATNEDLARVLLEDLWKGKFNDRTLPEFAPVTRDVFITHGVKMLTNQPSDASQLVHDWWKVRMGESLRISKTHQMVAINIFHDDGGSEVGHFCIGIREIGGNPDEDFVIDIRAPWYSDDPASFMRALNHDKSLINQLITNNMYDWLYTQSEFRGCRSVLWFTAISDEQVRLLQTILKRKDRLKSGPFKPLKGNCASIGEKILDRILPLDHDFQLLYTIGDVPFPTAKQTVRRFGGEIAKIILHVHQREGFAVTAKSEIHPAEPGRTTSSEFLKLREVPGIN